MANIAIIPAKGYSHRIPNKNFMDFCGKLLVDWSVIQASYSGLIDKVVVSTDNMGYEPCKPIIILPRPSSLCTDTTTQEEVIVHAIECLQLKDDDNIVLLQPTSPLRLTNDIDNAIKIKNNGNSVISATLDNEPFFFDGGIIERFNPLYRENGSIYVFSVSEFITNNSRYSGWNEIYNMVKWQQFEIDEPEDIPLVELLMRKYVLKEI